MTENESIRGCFNIILLALVFVGLMAGVFGLASTVAPIGELHQMHMEERK